MRPHVFSFVPLSVNVKRGASPEALDQLLVTGDDIHIDHIDDCGHLADNHHCTHIDIRGAVLPGRS